MILPWDPPWEIMEMVDKTRFPSWDGLELQTWYFIEKNIHCIISHRIHGIDTIFPYVKMVDNVDKYTHGYSEFGAFDFFPSTKSTSNDSVGFCRVKTNAIYMCLWADSSILATWTDSIETLSKLGKAWRKKHVWKHSTAYKSLIKNPGIPKTAPETSVSNASTGRDSGFPSGAGAVICSWLDPSKKHHPHSLNLTVDAPEN